MKTRSRKIAAGATALALLLGGVACGDDGEDGVEGDEIQQEVEDGAEDVQEGVEDLGNEVEEQVDEGAEEGGGG